MDSIITQRLNKLNYDNRFTKTQLDMIKYSILCIGADLSKFVILFLLFKLLHYPSEFLYAFLTTTLLRIFSGGKHLKTYSGCLAFSFIYFTVLIALSVSIGFISYVLIVSILSSVILLIITPQIPLQSGRKLKSNPLILRFMIFIFIIIYFTLFLKLKEPIYSIGLLTIIFQTIQLLILKGENYGEQNKEKKNC